MNQHDAEQAPASAKHGQADILEAVVRDERGQARGTSGETDRHATLHCRKRIDGVRPEGIAVKHPQNSIRKATDHRLAGQTNMKTTTSVEISVVGAVAASAN